MVAQTPHVLRPPREVEIVKPREYERVLELKAAYYDQFDQNDLMSRIAVFRRSRAFLSEDGYLEGIRGVLRTDSALLIQPYSWDEIPPGSTLLRVRPMTRPRALEGNFIESDLWEPPAQRVQPGRFNAAGERLLYTCLGMPRGTFAEARVTEPGQGFLLCFYLVEHPLCVRRIGETNPDSGLSAEHQAIERTISMFLAEEASARGDRKGQGRAYGRTRRILQEFFPLEPHWEHGWMFASTLDADVVNIALLPSAAHARLKFDVGIFGSLAELPDGTVGQRFAGFTDGKPRIGDYLGIVEFDHDRMRSIEDYYHSIGYSTEAQ